jgi:hypothetical protein
MYMYMCVFVYVSMCMKLVGRLFPHKVCGSVLLMVLWSMYDVGEAKGKVNVCCVSKREAAERGRIEGSLEYRFFLTVASCFVGF